jgi:predicted transcriptional regulator
MTTGKFRHIPVIERDQLVGIVSIGDIVKHRLCEMEQESAALRDYISERVGSAVGHPSQREARCRRKAAGSPPVALR